MRNARLVAILAIGLISPAALSAEAEQRALKVFAAASLKESLDQIGAAWSETAGQGVAVSFAGSSALAKQIEAGAPADIFISADSEWMDYLAERKLLEPGSRFNLVGNALVVIAPSSSSIQTLELTDSALRSTLGSGRLAVAEVESVPAGRYAKASLSQLGLWSAVSGSLAQAENVRAALAFVALGEAPLGIVYATDAKADLRVRVVAHLPSSSHAAIVYPAAKVATSTNPGADRFLQFLKSPEPHAILQKAGFSVP